jgi:hypothetical protein
MLVFSYEPSERPPAPYLEVHVAGGLLGVPAIPARAKLDSGASLTVLPVTMVRQLILDPTGAIDVRAYDGRVTTRLTYEVGLLIGSRRFDSLRVTVARRRNVLLGRDVMNQLLITLDSHQLTLTIHDA